MLQLKCGCVPGDGLVEEEVGDGEDQEGKEAHQEEVGQQDVIS